MLNWNSFKKNIMKQLNGNKKIYLNDFLVIYEEVLLEEHLDRFGILILARDDSQWYFLGELFGFLIFFYGLASLQYFYSYADIILYRDKGTLFRISDIFLLSTFLLQFLHRNYSNYDLIIQKAIEYIQKSMNKL